MKKKKLILPLVILAIILIVGGVGIFIIKKHTIENIYVEGNIHYTNEQIIDMVMTDPMDYNSLFLSMKYSGKEIRDIPFIEKLDVNVLEPDTIKLMVYEKSLAGYVEYLGRFIYFDKDGIVVESTKVKTLDIPLVSGLKFESVTLYEQLPVENPEVFDKVLDITKLLSKYKLSTDRIYFSENRDMTLYFGGVRVLLGDGSSIDEKITKLQYILPELEGHQGALDMQNYTGADDTITFVTDT
ncbi:MAG: cell division protein FtsQ [Lachnospiraceae bacterium]|nr:cell division protein FtsQ [Candidatus Merdinaster equi]